MTLIRAMKTVGPNTDPWGRLDSVHTYTNTRSKICNRMLLQGNEFNLTKF